MVQNTELFFDIQSTCTAQVVFLKSYATDNNTLSDARVGYTLDAIITSQFNLKQSCYHV